MDDTESRSEHISIKQTSHVSNTLVFPTIHCHFNLRTVVSRIGVLERVEASEIFITNLPKIKPKPSLGKQGIPPSQTELETSNLKGKDDTSIDLHAIYESLFNKEPVVVMHKLRLGNKAPSSTANPSVKNHFSFFKLFDDSRHSSSDDDDFRVIRDELNSTRHDKPASQKGKGQGKIGLYSAKRQYIPDPTSNSEHSQVSFHRINNHPQKVCKRIRRQRRQLPPPSSLRGYTSEIIEYEVENNVCSIRRRDFIAQSQLPFSILSNHLKIGNDNSIKEKTVNEITQTKNTLQIQGKDCIHDNLEKFNWQEPSTPPHSPQDSPPVLSPISEIKDMNPNLRKYSQPPRLTPAIPDFNISKILVKDVGTGVYKSNSDNDCDIETIYDKFEESRLKARLMDKADTNVTVEPLELKETHNIEIIEKKNTCELVPVCLNATQIMEIPINSSSHEGMRSNNNNIALAGTDNEPNEDISHISEVEIRRECIPTENSGTFTQSLAQQENHSSITPTILPSSHNQGGNNTCSSLSICRVKENSVDLDSPQRVKVGDVIQDVESCIISTIDLSEVNLDEPREILTICKVLDFESHNNLLIGLDRKESVVINANDLGFRKEDMSSAEESIKIPLPYPPVVVEENVQNRNLMGEEVDKFLGNLLNPDETQNECTTQEESETTFTQSPSQCSTIETNPDEITMPQNDSALPDRNSHENMHVSLLENSTNTDNHHKSTESLDVNLECENKEQPKCDKINMLSMWGNYSPISDAEPDESSDNGSDLGPLIFNDSPASVVQDDEEGPPQPDLENRLESYNSCSDSDREFEKEKVILPMPSSTRESTDKKRQKKNEVQIEHKKAKVISQIFRSQQQRDILQQLNKLNENKRITRAREKLMVKALKYKRSQNPARIMNTFKSYLTCVTELKAISMQSTIHPIPISSKTKPSLGTIDTQIHDKIKKLPIQLRKLRPKKIISVVGENSHANASDSHQPFSRRKTSTLPIEEVQRQEMEQQFPPSSSIEPSQLVPRLDTMSNTETAADPDGRKSKVPVKEVQNIFASEVHNICKSTDDLIYIRPSNDSSQPLTEPALNKSMPTTVLYYFGNSNHPRSPQHESERSIVTQVEDQTAGTINDAAIQPRKKRINEYLKKLSYCDVCNQSYRCPCSASLCLYVHSKIKCWICFKILNRWKGSLFKHNRCYHPSPYQCQFCPQGMVLKLNLEFRRHMERDHFKLPDGLWSRNLKKPIGEEEWLPSKYHLSTITAIESKRNTRTSKTTCQTNTRNLEQINSSELQLHRISPDLATGQIQITPSSPDGANSEQINSGQINLERINLEQINSPELQQQKISPCLATGQIQNMPSSQDGANFEQINSEQVNSEQINSEQIHSPELQQQRISPGLATGQIQNMRSSQDGANLEQVNSPELQQQGISPDLGTSQIQITPSPPDVVNGTTNDVVDVSWNSPTHINKHMDEDYEGPLPTASLGTDTTTHNIEADNNGLSFDSNSRAGLDHTIAQAEAVFQNSSQISSPIQEPRPIYISVIVPNIAQQNNIARPTVSSVGTSLEMLRLTECNSTVAHPCESTCDVNVTNSTDEIEARTRTIIVPCASATSQHSSDTTPHQSTHSLDRHSQQGPNYRPVIQRHGFSTRHNNRHMPYPRCTFTIPRHCHIPPNNTPSQIANTSTDQSRVSRDGFRGSYISNSPRMYRTTYTYQHGPTQYCTNNFSTPASFNNTGNNVRGQAPFQSERDWNPGTEYARPITNVPRNLIDPSSARAQITNVQDDRIPPTTIQNMNVAEFNTHSNQSTHNILPNTEFVGRCKPVLEAILSGAQLPVILTKPEITTITAAITSWFATMSEIDRQNFLTIKEVRPSIAAFIIGSVNFGDSGLRQQNWARDYWECMATLNKWLK